MQWRTERIEAGQRKFAIDHRFMRKCAARTAIFLGHRGAEESGLACLCPDVAIVDAGFMPAVQMRNELVGNKPPRLLLAQDKSFAHPYAPREIDCLHWLIAFRPNIRPRALPREAALQLLLGRVLHVWDLVDFDVLAFAIDLLNTADIHGLHDVSVVRIN